VWGVGVTLQASSIRGDQNGGNLTASFPTPRTFPNIGQSNENGFGFESLFRNCSTTKFLLVKSEWFEEKAETNFCRAWKRGYAVQQWLRLSWPASNEPHFNSPNFNPMGGSFPSKIYPIVKISSRQSWYLI
jgi:hypothetical protein